MVINLFGSNLPHSPTRNGLIVPVDQALTAWKKHKSRSCVTFYFFYFCFYLLCSEFLQVPGRALIHEHAGKAYKFLSFYSYANYSFFAQEILFYFVKPWIEFVRE